MTKVAIYQQMSLKNQLLKTFNFLACSKFFGLWNMFSYDLFLKTYKLNFEESLGELTCQGKNSDLLIFPTHLLYQFGTTCFWCRYMQNCINLFCWQLPELQPFCGVAVFELMSIRLSKGYIFQLKSLFRLFHNCFYRRIFRYFNELWSVPIITNKIYNF